MKRFPTRIFLRKRYSFDDDEKKKLVLYYKAYLFDFNYFVDNIKNKNIIFDSGMYEGNSRNYSQFRSSANNFWNILITEEY